MAYTNFTNCTANEYKNIIYSQNSTNRIKIWFNNVELLDADEYCVSLESTNRILPDDGGKRFTLENFVSKELTLILRDLPQNTIIQDQVRISIGTLVGNNTYEDVPIGIFNIQDTPETDQNKVTIKLRDNRVKFDFYYNAKPLMDSLGGTATLGQILNDICTKAGVTNNVGTFNGSDKQIAIYDNTITATTYVTYILGQAGYIPTIDRNGNLIKINLSNLAIYRIPLSIVEKYEIGNSFNIQRIVYESGIIKYQSSNDETLETLYLDAANPYITEQSQITFIYNLLYGFEIDSVTTGKILGNPAIDSYDLIQVYDDEDINETIIFTTLANNTFKYTGVFTNTFDTQIGTEERTENVSLRSEPTFQKWAKTTIDNLNGEIIQTVGQINGIEGYVLTEDTTFQSDKTYYTLVNNEYVEYTNYNVGDPIVGDIYEVDITTKGLIQRMDSAETRLSADELNIDFMYGNFNSDGSVKSLETPDVENKTTYKFNKNGLRIGKSTDDYNSLQNNTGTYYYEKDKMLAKYTKDGAVIKNIAVFGGLHYGVDDDIDVANYNKEKALFIGQLYVDETDHDECYGHFWNGS